MSSSEPEDGNLLCSVQLVDTVFFSSHLQALFPCGPEVVSQDCFCFPIRHVMGSLFQSAACLGETVCFLVAHDAAVGGNPLQDHRCFETEGVELSSDIQQNLVSFSRLQALKEGFAVREEDSMFW